MRTETQKTTYALYIGMILAFAIGALTGVSTAHTPCDRQECGWETVVHPITAEITQEYICK